MHSEQALACADFMLPSWEGVLRLRVTHISLGVGVSSMRTSAWGFPPFSVLLTRRTCLVRAYPSAWGGLKATWRPSRLLCSPFPSGSSACFAHCCGGIGLRAGVSPCASRHTSVQMVRFRSCNNEGSWIADAYGMAQAKHTLIGPVFIDLTRVRSISCGMSGFPLVLLIVAGVLHALGCRVGRL